MLKCKLLADIISRQSRTGGRQSSRPVSRRLYKLTIGILFYGRYPMPFFESHNRYAHRILGRFDGYCAGIEKKNSAGGGLHNILLILSHTEHIDYREFLTIRLNQLLAIRFSLIGGEVYLQACRFQRRTA